MSRKYVATHIETLTNISRLAMAQRFDKNIVRKINCCECYEEAVSSSEI